MTEEVSEPLGGGRSETALQLAEQEDDAPGTAAVCTQPERSLRQHIGRGQRKV